MRRHYSTLYLRTSFELSDASRVKTLVCQVKYDDGFSLWINGIQVLAKNAPENPTHDAEATDSHESRHYEEFLLPDPAEYLRDGKNVVAVQGFNVSVRSGDFTLDLAIVDPTGVDATCPTLEAVIPCPGTSIPHLGRIKLTFSEEVKGVDAADLLVNGKAALSVTGEGRGPYVFTLP